jgi:hypothetical protein
MDSLVAAFEHGLDAAIGSVPHPAGHAGILGLTPATLAEEDSLHIAAYDDTTSDHDSAV